MRPFILATALFVAAIGVTLSGARAADTSDTPSRASRPASADLTRARDMIAKKDWNAAIAELQRAARTEPKNADVHNLLGYSYRNAGQLDKAFSEYEIALKLDPKHKGAHEYLGVAYLVAKQPDKAKEQLAALKSICGENCGEYEDLAKAIADYKT